MKKKLLFVIPSLDLGGAEKSLVNLLNCIDFTRYEVDVFLFSKKGIFLDLLPKEVHILPVSEDFKTFSLSFFSSLFGFLKQGKINLLLKKVLFSIVNFKSKNPSLIEQKSWKYLSNFFPKIGKEYDAAISYLEKSSLYFLVEKIVATKKIAWLHTNIEELNLDLNFEKKYFEKIDKLATVSDVLVEKYQHIFPEFSGKFTAIENINSPNIINALAENTSDVLQKNNTFKIICVGRLAEEKALHLAIEALEILRNKNYNAELYLIGEGNKRTFLERLTKEKNLTNKVHFLGALSNPYPYIKNADLFLMTSVFEGKSIALEEAKILKKPIVITNFSTATEQIINRKTGLIAQMNAQSVADIIEKLMIDVDFKNKMVENLSSQQFGNEKEVEKLYHIIND